jgi:hypothetical protein
MRESGFAWPILGLSARLGLPFIATVNPKPHQTENRRLGNFGAPNICRFKSIADMKLMLYAADYVHRYSPGVFADH